MSVNSFYNDLLAQVAVSQEDIDAARTKRDELGAVLVGAVGAKMRGASFFPAGALAAGTQIRPLNDVDVVVEIPSIPEAWVTDAAAAMREVEGLLKTKIKGTFELSTHAIKITYPDEDFTADVVVGWKQEVGILIPECPEDGAQRWIPSHPRRHAEQVRERNKNFGSAAFSREIRILKYLNREWGVRDEEERKPLSSFHVTALALAILETTDTYADMTPLFLESASRLVRSPLSDPAGVGEPLVANDPEYAAGLLADAGAKTRRALSAPADEAERILLEVFGKPSERESILGPKPVSVNPAGKLIPGTAGVRLVKPVRSHGDGKD